MGRGGGGGNLSGAGIRRDCACVCPGCAVLRPWAARVGPAGLGPPSDPGPTESPYTHTHLFLRRRSSKGFGSRTEGLFPGEELTNPSSGGAGGGRREGVRGERWGQGGCGAPLPCREGGCIAKDAPLG